MSEIHSQNLPQILKHNFGKELSKVTLPVWYCEPLSLTQKGMDHSHHDLLNEANLTEN